MRIYRKIMLGLVLSVLGFVAVGVGFAMGLSPPADLVKGVLHSPGIVLWSITSGFGWAWLIGQIAIQIISAKYDRPWLLASSQGTISVLLGLSMSHHWFI